jgi:RimJ/RimL family protein N-acetyltransferase
LSSLVFDQQAVADWVGKLNGKPFDPPFSAFGVINSDGRLTGGFVFNNFTQTAVELSLAGRGIASRPAWRSVLHYVFVQLGCARLQVHTRRSNKAVASQAPKMGFRFEGVARRMYGDEDGLCFSLTVDDLPKFKERWKL